MLVLGVTIDGNSGQIITATAATFGNVTVGGTLTYDDVTNIDSIGLITARNGLQVLAGVALGPVTIGNTMSLGDFDMLRFGANAQRFANTLLMATLLFRKLEVVILIFCQIISTLEINETKRNPRSIQTRWFSIIKLRHLQEV